MGTTQAAASPAGTWETVTAALRADLLPWIFFAAALTLYLFRLSVPPRYVYDEVYHAYTAAQYAKANPDAFVWYTKAPDPKVAYTWNHPPLGLWCLAAGIRVWGDNAFGWRFSSAVFGAAGIALAYLLALAATGRRVVAALAAVLLLLDGLYFVQSRTSMLDVFGTFFLMAALLAFLAYVRAEPDRVVKPLIFTGLFLGLAIATKWNFAYPSACIGLYAVGRTALLTRDSIRPGARAAARAGLRAHWIGIPVGLWLLPAVVYLAAYVPFFLVGHTAGEFVELQRQIYVYHSRLTATHAYQSRWWQWPLALRPVWYHVDRASGTVANIYANGNPVLYWGVLPAVAFVILRWWRERNDALPVIVVGFLGTWLPWMFVPRIAFAYHFLPAVPAGVTAVAVALAHVAGGGRAGRILAVTYVAAVAAAFVFFYPIWSGVPLAAAAFERRLWLPSWR